MNKPAAVPTDPTAYAPGKTVIVKDQLSTSVDYAYSSRGEKISGIRTFTPWDKDDFQIYEDTTITGGWMFEPFAPTPTPLPASYTYYVHYVLLNDMRIEAAAVETRNIDKLGTIVTEYPKTGKDLKAVYRKYLAGPVTEMIIYDCYHIIRKVGQLNRAAGAVSRKAAYV